jgi:hypothetical protein
MPGTSSVLLMSVVVDTVRLCSAVQLDSASRQVTMYRFLAAAMLAAAVRASVPLLLVHLRSASLRVSDMMPENLRKCGVNSGSGTHESHACQWSTCQEQWYVIE